MAWTDEEKATAISEYQDANPTAENSKEIVANIAGEMGKSPNGVRMILVRAGVYQTAEPAAKKTTGGGGTRVSKEAAQQSLADAISATGAEPDMTIITKLTGKACVYLTGVITPE